MDEFLALALSFPTVVFSTLLLVVLAYWCFVILGALDIDAFDLERCLVQLEVVPHDEVIAAVRLEKPAQDRFAMRGTFRA